MGFHYRFSLVFETVYSEHCLQGVKDEPRATLVKLYGLLSALKRS